MHSVGWMQRKSFLRTTSTFGRSERRGRLCPRGTAGGLRPPLAAQPRQTPKTFPTRLPSPRRCPRQTPGRRCSPPSRRPPPALPAAGVTWGCGEDEGQQAAAADEPGGAQLHGRGGSAAGKAAPHARRAAGLRRDGAGGRRDGREGRAARPLPALRPPPSRRGTWQRGEAAPA